MSSQAVQHLPALGLIVVIGAIALIGVMLMIADLCRQMVGQMWADSADTARKGGKCNR
jgi:hypothetical protein